MKEIGLYDAKSKLSALIAEVEASGETVMITRHGKIVAELHPHRPTALPKRGCLKSAGFFIAADFDESEAGFEDFFDDAPGALRVAEEFPPYRTKKDS